jgi:N-acetylglucosamine malate deacetylase 1
MESERMKIKRQVKRVLRQLQALRASDGQYRFLVRKWDSISEIDLALRVMGTEYFKTEMVPLPLPVEGLRSMLVIAPHQDDDAIGAGGTMLLARRAGVKIDVLFVTDGGEAGDAEIVGVRDREAGAACAMIGATKHDLGISNAAPQPTLADLGRLSELLHRLKPQVVLVPWLLDSPAKHRMVNHLLWLAHRQFGLPDFEVWGYQVHNTLFPNGYVDITEVAEGKRELIRCYKSQLEASCRYDHVSLGLAAWNSRFLDEGGAAPRARYVEAFFALPQHEHLRLVEKFYFDDLDVTYRSNALVAPAVARLHADVTRSLPPARRAAGRGIPQPESP